MLKLHRNFPHSRGNSSHNPETSGSTSISQVKMYRTPTGPLFLRSCCSPSFVADLQVDEGLCAFARRSEREHQLLLTLAGQSDTWLTLAYTATGKIVGQATLAPVYAWWQGIGKAYEIAVEVSSGWRNLGIAHQLLSHALDFASLEEYLILSLGFSWHWDYKEQGMTPFQYREMIVNLFAAHGFVEYLTSEPNIRENPANVMLARLGSHFAQESMERFYERLLLSDTLPGI